MVRYRRMYSWSQTGALWYMFLHCHKDCQGKLYGLWYRSHRCWSRDSIRLLYCSGMNPFPASDTFQSILCMKKIYDIASSQCKNTATILLTTLIVALPMQLADGSKLVSWLAAQPQQSLLVSFWKTVSGMFCSRPSIPTPTVSKRLLKSHLIWNWPVWVGSMSLLLYFTATERELYMLRPSTARHVKWYLMRVMLRDDPPTSCRMPWVMAVSLGRGHSCAATNLSCTRTTAAWE